MSKAAFGTRHSAFGKTDSKAAVLQNQVLRSASLVHEAGSRPSAECRVPNAGFLTAILCTVTHADTSVTTLPLVESGLIIVGRANCRWAETAANRGFGLAAHCSFQGDMCIQ
jgi:hypothetical protein